MKIKTIEEILKYLEEIRDDLEICDDPGCKFCQEILKSQWNKAVGNTVQNLIKFIKEE